MSAEGFDTDQAMAAIGGGSKWTLLVYCATNLIFNCPAGWAMLATVFVGAEVTHHCTIPDELRPPGHVHLNQSIPMEKTDSGEMVLSKCKMFLNFSSSTNKTVDCTHGWTYGNEMTTIASEWDLVCDDSFYPETTQTVLVLGVLVGALVMAILSDMYGRKTVCLGSVLGISIVTFITAWVNNYYLFTALRFITGILQQGIVLPGFVLACELFPAEQRTVAGLVIQCFWGIGMCILALFAYCIRDWRNLLIATSIPGLLSIPLYWVIPESIPWLVAKYRFKEAKEILKKAAKFNGVELPKEFQLNEEDETLLNEKSEEVNNKPSVAVRIRGCCHREKTEKTSKHEQADYTLIDVMKSSKLRMFAFIMCYLWCVSSLVYYGLSLSTGSLAGNRYLNFFLSGIVEIPAYLVAAALLHFIGRRYPICAFHLLAGIPLLACLGIPNVTSSGTSLVGLKTSLSMVSKFGIAACFGCVFLYAPELFPTTIRNASMGIASVGGRLGNIFAPFSSYVVKILPWFPGLLFGVMAIIAGFLTLVLPETLHRPLPLTIEEVEQWSRTLSKEDKDNYKKSRLESKARKRALEMEPVPNDVS